ncbi:flagellar hook-basal body family protein, partial [Vibrio parahaemolyticus AQ3810]
MDRALFLAMRG